jgi:Ni2+-binding GTPase involved in maturation of urease and hydrogenase
LSIKKLACGSCWPGQDMIHKSLPLKLTCVDFYIVNKKDKASQVHVTVGFFIFIYGLFSGAVVSCDYSVE